MNVIDLTILTIIAVSTVAGFVRGLIRELFAFGAVVLGLLIAYQFYGVSAPYVAVVVGNTSVALATSFVLILLLVSLGIGWLGRWLSALSKKSGLKPEDRRAGAMLGFIRGVVVVSFLLLAAATLIPKSEGMMSESTLGPIGVRLAKMVVDVLPDSVKSRFQGGLLGNAVKNIALINQGG